MLKLFQLIFLGHIHKYKIIERQEVHSSLTKKNLPFAFDFILQCEHCGNIKKKRV